MKTPLISVIMSVKDSESSIMNAVESILNQSYKNFELLINDDGSTDSTFSKLENISKKDKRIKLFKNSTCIGLTKSLNILIEESSGKLIARQDADDYSKRNRLSIQVEHLNVNKLDAVSSRAINIQSEKIVPRVSHYLPIKKIIKYKNPFIHGTLIIKKEVLGLLGNYDEKFYYAQDYKLMKDFLKLGYRISVLKDPLYYLNTVNNISSIKKEEQKYYFKCAQNDTEPKLII